MKIFIIGQTTLHWGRMEFGNIGNYYIIEPFIRELHNTFPDADIKTTLQMSDQFCKKEKVEVLPMELYYGFNNDDLSNALVELSLAWIYNKTNHLPFTTPFINEINKADLIVDFSGDIWGDNANILGENRFLIGLMKDRIAQLLRKKTALLAGSPGPFSNSPYKEFAKEVFHNFNLVTNRENTSQKVLAYEGFHNDNLKNLSCPAFLFEPKTTTKIKKLIDRLQLKKQGGIGFILCGWNFVNGPFDLWPRKEEDYDLFVESIQYINNVLNQRVFLLSHSNGFPIPPKQFKLIHGRDYKILKQLYEILKKKGIHKSCILIDEILTPKETKSLINNFDMLISGRVHGAVAGLSQNIPTVIVDYGHEPKAHKLKGFANEAGVSDYLADPAKSHDLINKITACWKNKNLITENLSKQIPIVQEKAKQNFKYLKDLF